MEFTRARDFKADTAWGKQMLAEFNGTDIKTSIGVKIHWTDQPYRWHTNTGKEVFVVLDGAVDMHYREKGKEYIKRMEIGDALSIGAGEEHVAHPVGEARILVIEHMDSE